MAACHVYFFFFFQAEDGIRDLTVTGVQTCALPISRSARPRIEHSSLPQKPLGGRGDRETAPEQAPASRPELRAHGAGGHPPRSAEQSCSRVASKRREIGRASCRERV